MTRKQKKHEDDDGRTIADMNVDGMPWYIDKSRTEGSGNTSDGQEQLRGSEKRAFIWGVMKAVLIITAVFAVGYYLFILFCNNIWLA